MSHDFFVSHSTKDKKTADKICALLEAEGFRCWIAPRNINPGEEWPVAIVRAVTNCRAMILVLSKNANHSKDVNKETLLAINSKIDLYVIKIEEFELTGKMKFYLADPELFGSAEKTVEEQVQEVIKIAQPLLAVSERASETTVPGGKTEAKMKTDPLEKPATKGSFLRSKKIVYPSIGFLTIIIAGFIYLLLGAPSEQTLVKSVYAGGSQSFILLESGDLYAFGNARRSSLGLGDTENRTLPVKNNDLGPVIKISVGDEHALALLEEGQLFTFGYNRFGQLGLGDTEERSLPVQLDIFGGPGVAGYDSQGRPLEGVAAEDASLVQAISAGERHSLVLFENGDLYSFGFKAFGQLGHSGQELSDAAFSALSLISPPERVNALSAQGIRDISAGYDFTLVVLINGDVYSFGLGSDGQLGHGDDENQMEPKKIETIGNAVAVSAGQRHSLVLMENGDVYSFGRGNEGQLGHGNRETYNLPSKIEGLSNAIAIKTGMNHSMVLTSDGSLYTFGSGRFGALGHGNEEDCLVPTKIEILGKVKTIAAGTWHSLVLTEDEAIYSFGSNNYGQLGLGDTADRYEPVKLESFWLAENE